MKIDKFLEKFFFKISFTFSTLILIYVIIRSDILITTEKLEYYLPFFLFSFALFFISFFIKFTKKENKIYVFVIVLSLLFSLYLLEGIIRIFKFDQILYSKYHNIDKKIQIYEKVNKNKYDTRSIYQVYESLIKKNINAFVKVSPYIFLKKEAEIFPLSSKSLSKTIYKNENGYFKIYDSDRYGFNNPDEIWDKSQYDIVLIGDSFIHGCCVKEEDEIATYLRSHTNGNILNLGFSSNGPLISYAALREYLTKSTAHIFWFYYEGNDIEDLEEEIQNNILNNYLLDRSYSQNLKKKQKNIDSLVNKEFEKSLDSVRNLNFKKKKFFYNFFDYIKIYKVRNIIKLSLKSLRITAKKENTSNYKNIEKIFKEIKTFSLQNKSKLTLVYLPEFKRYINKYDETNYKKIKQLSKNNNINFIDINKLVFEKENDPLNLFPFKMNGHYNATGYEKISKELIKYIDSNFNK